MPQFDLTSAVLFVIAVVLNFRRLLCCSIYSWMIEMIIQVEHRKKQYSKYVQLLYSDSCAVVGFTGSHCRWCFSCSASIFTASGSLATWIYSTDIRLVLRL